MSTAPATRHSEGQWTHSTGGGTIFSPHHQLHRPCAHFHCRPTVPVAAGVVCLNHPTTPNMAAARGEGKEQGVSREEALGIFSLFDADGSGTIDHSELRELAFAMGVTLGQDKVR